MAEVHRSPWFFFFFPCSAPVAARSFSEIKGTFCSKRVPEIDVAAQLSPTMCEQQEPMAVMLPFQRRQMNPSCQLQPLMRPLTTRLALVL